MKKKCEITLLVLEIYSVSTIGLLNFKRALLIPQVLKMNDVNPYVNYN